MSKDPEKAGLKKEDLADDITASSSFAEDSSDMGMPLFKYARLVGSLPRLARREGGASPFSSPCTCTAMGKIVLAPDVLDGSADGDTLSKRQSDLVWKYPHYVLAMGFENAQLCLVDARTGVEVVPSDQFKESSRAQSVVDVGFDSSGTFLAALYANGLCTIWELRYAASIESTAAPRTPSRTAATTEPASGQPDNVFASFLTNLKGPAATTTGSDDTPSPESPYSTTSMPVLKTTSCQASRISYPSSFGTPSCLAVDPAYKKRRDKTILVGFRDGRIVMTKKGFLGRRKDEPIYQATSGPIEDIVWRGPLAAWAEDSGIKLFDVESMIRIAHVDRPTGARASLYPTITSLRPTLLFEASDSLLCAWGDCLMSMSVQEKTGRREESTSERSDTAGEAKVVKRRTVQCNMAWELDCVACGVVPLDEEHVAVLGLVPIWEEEGAGSNDLELHIMSRSEGTVTYADALPLVEPPNSTGKNSAAGFSLLSSFAVPRMEDAIEAQEDPTLFADDDEMDFQMTLFGPATKIEPFTDPHKKWNLKQLAFEDYDTDQNEQADKVSEDSEDTQSVDSDDYSFVLRPLQPVSDDDVPPLNVFPPLMVIASPFDAVVVRAREVDDAVSHALSAKKYGLALRRALTHKRQLREYDINQLIDEYLRAVLRMNAASEKDEKSLSIRRVNLAAQAMPMLLGGHIRMWERWVDEFGKIPGGLFVLREELPVRDPILPPRVYHAALMTMLSEIEGVLTTTVDDIASGDEVFLYPQMMRHFLSALVAWGPTRSLREKIQLHEYNDDRRRKKVGTAEVSDDPLLIDAEKALHKRLHQTSAGYLQLPGTSSESPSEPATPVNAASASVDDTSDSLFSVDEVLTRISQHVPLFAATDQEAVGVETANNHAALEAMAELKMMKGDYEAALKCFLAIGCLHVTPDVADVEESAILAVSGSRQKATGSNQYGFVLAMIEYQHLHQCLLEEDFLSSSLNDKFPMKSTPLVALMQLVGLENAGDFLVEHCVPPPAPKPPMSPASFHSRASDVSTTDDVPGRHETLPINLVADQLRSRPKLFHWYLHQIFTRKPEMYVKFPRTAVPPRPVTELHRSHLELYIEFTDKRDSAKALSGIEIYNLERMTTPLLLFLKTALPLGGIRPDEARRLLEAERTGNRQGVDSDVVQFPHYFAIELAYVIEHFGKGSEEDAKQILDLYLNGAKSLMLAVSYAQRNTTYSSQLWITLIDHCLNSAQEEDGSLFGSLLECAALCGADLAHLVTQIPQGMEIEGLRPRLVAAVADYRWKLKMHEAASGIGMNERIVLLRELTHRSKRGMRFSKLAASPDMDALSPASSPGKTASKDEAADGEQRITKRPIERPDRYQVSFSVPLR